MAPIYTKKGDDGTTGLLGGKRVLKTDPLFEALGTVDELNALLGVCISALKGTKISSLKKDLLNVQDKLFSIGSNLAKTETPQKDVTVPMRPTENDILDLERYIDKFDKETLTPLKNFILPGGHPAAAYLQLARSVCRRAERRMFGIKKVNPIHKKYLNRLSDYLFTLSRAVNAKTSTKETIWKTN